MIFLYKKILSIGEEEMRERIITRVIVSHQQGEINIQPIELLIVLTLFMMSSF